MTTLDDRARAISDELVRQTGMALNVPDDVPVRIAVLLGEDPVHLETDLRAGHAAPWHVFALGSSRVLWLTVALAEDGRTRVEVEVWSRKRLRSVRVAPGMGENGMNQNNVWFTVPSNGWPNGGALELTYEGRPEPLVLPLSWRRLTGAVVDSLLADLS